MKEIPYVAMAGLGGQFQGSVFGMILDAGLMVKFVLLLLLVPAGMYVLGTTHPEWFEWTERDEAIYQASRKAEAARRQAYDDAEWREWAARNREA